MAEQALRPGLTAQHGAEITQEHKLGSKRQGELEVRRYTPLDVKSWGEAFRVTLGWLLVPTLAIVTTVLLWAYEMKVINVSDRDLRDMYYDQRINTKANEYYHKHFINAETCCNTDPLLFGNAFCGYRDVTAQFQGTYMRSEPWCPPRITIRCPGSLNSSVCNLTRAALYPLLGINPLTGAYQDCLLAGKVLVGVEVVPVGQPLILQGYSLSEGYQPIVPRDPEDPNDVTPVVFAREVPVEQLAVGNPFNIDITAFSALIETMLARYGNAEYTSPNVQLSLAFALGGVPMQLKAPLPNEGNPPISSKSAYRTITPWPFPIFAWPGVLKGQRCPGSDVWEQWYLWGTITVYIPPFDYTTPSSALSELTFLQDSIQVPLWRLRVLDSIENATGQGQSQASLEVLNSITVYVGMVQSSGACLGWMFDESLGTNTNFSYTVVQQGDLASFISGPYNGDFNTQVNITVYDLAGPQQLALPFYGGMWYIVMCFAMGAVWAFSLGPFLVFALPLIWWNVRSNAGMPPYVYRWMKKYRGW